MRIGMKHQVNIIKEQKEKKNNKITLSLLTQSYFIIKKVNIIPTNNSFVLCVNKRIIFLLIIGQKKVNVFSYSQSYPQYPQSNP